MFASALRALAPLADDELLPALEAARACELRPREALLEAGAPAREVAVVVRGLLREYFLLEDGGERTKAFVCEGQLSGSLADLLSTGPSRAFIVAEEPTRVVLCPYATLHALGQRRPAWAALGRVALERLLLTKAEREWELLALDAAGRWAAFRARYPGLEARALGKHVASYLGITPVHLSRLRARRARAGR